MSDPSARQVMKGPTSMKAAPIPEQIGGLPNICGAENQIASSPRAWTDTFMHKSDLDFAQVRSCFAIALHMHQPLVPAGGDDLLSAPVISNLKHMLDHPNVGDNHNAPVFHWCYKRMGRFIPELVEEGNRPRIMLDYSGCLLHGLQTMGLQDVLDSLRTITCDPRYRYCVEWLGSAWGHPVAPSTPVQDYRLHVQAWRHHFASIFGAAALERVRGFSPAEMALPNHAEVAYEFVKTLKACGYRWVLVQEHTVERVEDGGPIRQPHVPHQLTVRNARGERLTILAIIKTQGSDTKLVGQMQPYYEAKGLAKTELVGKTIPRLVTQIADGENGGVMMNEFPPKFMDVMRQASGSETPPVNVSEYLAYLESIGITEEDCPPIQPAGQYRIWSRLGDRTEPEELERVIKQLKAEDASFHVEGGSWTNNISWVRGHEQTLQPINQVSARFAEKVLGGAVPTTDPRYCNALYHLLLTQTSCYRYWGEGVWTDYGRELCRRAMGILERDFA